MLYIYCFRSYLYITISFKEELLNSLEIAIVMFKISSSVMSLGALLSNTREINLSYIVLSVYYDGFILLLKRIAKLNSSYLIIVLNWPSINHS